MSDFGPLVSPEWLSTNIGEPDLRVIDFRWYLSSRKGHDEYLAGHLPGAVFVDLEAVTGRGAGRHPLPSAEQFQGEMRRAGVSEKTRVVAYDDSRGSIAARLWFMLDWFGHHAQAVLDGGLQAWGGALTEEVPSVPAGDFEAHAPDRSRIVDFDVVSRLKDVPVLDARLGERYRGETEPVDPKAGHIPGARSAAWPRNLRVDGRFKSRAELREQFRELGVQGGEGAVVYCGSGVNACHDLFAMELAGIRDVRLYEGSWSDWSRHDAPVASGGEPGGAPHNEER